MALLKFKATIEILGVNLYVLVSARRAEKLKLGWRKPMPVLVRINGRPQESWSINMMPVGDGSFSHASAWGSAQGIGHWRR